MLNVSDELETDDTPQVSRKLSFSAAASPVSRGVSVMPIPDLVNSLSKSAIKKMVERLMTPKQDGSHKVPAELIAEWRSGDQNRLIDEFQKAGLDKDQIWTSQNVLFNPNFRYIQNYGLMVNYPYTPKTALHCTKP